MTTASVLLTVTTAWNVSSEKIEKEVCCMGRNIKNVTAEAAKELRESPATKEQALAMIREWIQQNNDIKNIRQDESFILRFLRHKKYSVPMAQQTLLKYLNLRKYYPEVFTKLDCSDANVKEILNNGYITVSPIRDSKGRRVIVYNMSRFNAQKFNCWDMCRAHMVVYETLLEDPVDQMCGYVHVGDGHGVTGALVTTWNPTDFARLLKWGEQSLPMRHKEFHMVNVPSALKYIVDFAASRLSPKIVSRLNIHINLKQLHQHMDTACLPASYGGELKCEDLVHYTSQLLNEQRSKLIDLDVMEILNTRGIISSRKNKTTTVNGDVSLQGSFRKLEID